MSAEQLFQRWVRWTLLAFAGCFGYYLLADLFMPLSTDSLMQKYVVQVAPEVTGRVSHVAVRSNQLVQAGDLLFELDGESYRLKLQLAELQLAQMQQKNQQLLASIDSHQAKIAKAKAQLQLASQEEQRARQLRAQQLISAQQLEQQQSVRQQAEAELAAAQAALAETSAEMGAAGTELLAIQQARTTVDQARLDLKRTQVYASVDGVVSDLQLEVGTLLASQQPVLALVSSQQSWISAAFREKSLLHVAQGTHALVTFDALPGQVFSAHVRDIDAGVASAQGKPDGQLASVESSTRWVRDAQRLKVNLTLDEQTPARLVVGSRATVQLLPDAEGLSGTLAGLQIRLISLLHYVY